MCRSAAGLKTGKSALEVVHTVLHAGGKFGGGGYKVSGGLHGVGVSVVNALSEWLRVESARDGSVWAQEYERGKPTTPVRSRAAGRSARDEVVFRADPEMFETTDFSFDTICPTDARSSAYLNQGTWITLIDERADRERTFYFEGGILSFVRHMNRNKEPLTQRPIYVERKEGDTSVEVALQYNDTYTENVLAFANNINTVDGGTHVTGFRTALTLAQRLRAQGRRAQGRRPQPHRRRRPRRPHRRHQRQGAGAPVRGSDKTPSWATPRSRAWPKPSWPTPDSSIFERTRRRPADHREVPDRVACPRGGPQGARPGHPQGRLDGLASRQARRLL